jgi:hypothetical protein
MDLIHATRLRLLGGAAFTFASNKETSADGYLNTVGGISKRSCVKRRRGFSVLS